MVDTGCGCESVNCFGTGLYFEKIWKMNILVLPKVANIKPKTMATVILVICKKRHLI
jgi:hypothetical protein